MKKIFGFVIAACLMATALLGGVAQSKAQYGSYDGYGYNSYASQMVRDNINARRREYVYGTRRSSTRRSTRGVRRRTRGARRSGYKSRSSRTRRSSRSR